MQQHDIFLVEKIRLTGYNVAKYSIIDFRRFIV